MVNQIIILKLDRVQTLAHCLSAGLEKNIICFIQSIGCRVLILRTFMGNMTFLMANNITLVLLVCVLYRLLLWSFLLVKVGAVGVWPTSFLSTHITNKSIWLRRIGSRLGVLSPFCSLSICSVNGDCMVNETLDVPPRTTDSFWIHQDFVSNIFFELRKKPFHLITGGDQKKLRNAGAQMLKLIGIPVHMPTLRKKAEIVMCNHFGPEPNNFLRICTHT